MKVGFWSKALFSATMVLAIALSAAQTGQAQSESGPNLGGEVVYDPVTGALAFVGTGPNQAIPSLLAGSTLMPSTQNASAFVAAYTSQLGLQDVAADLMLTRARQSVDGRSTIRYQQLYKGIPVFATDVIINTNARGAMTSLTAKTSPKLNVDVRPAITADQAATTALGETAKIEKVPAQDLSAGTPELQIYDARLLLDDGRPARLTWKVVVTARTKPVSEMVLVDSSSGAVSLYYNQIDTQFYKAGSTTGSKTAAATRPSAQPQLAGTPMISVYTYGHLWPESDRDYGRLVCNQSTASACLLNSDPDIVDAYQYALDTYNFYYNQFGRDSIDDGGMHIVSAVHFLEGYENAFWTGMEPNDSFPDNMMVYGDGFSAADDVIGHELTHGVTDSESGLIYYAQPGAINESLSDIFGELIDQTNGRGNDSIKVRWKLGEDIPGIGAIRSMMNPLAFHDPDRTSSSYYYLGYYDNAGVHENSGVNNKAAYLIAAGGSFYKWKIAGIGLLKTAAIYYEAQTHLLGTGSNYFDLYYALNQACTNLLGTQPPHAKSPIVAKDCAQVKKATEAVSMRTTPSTRVYPLAQYCPAGQHIVPGTTLFFDDFEHGPSKWVFNHNPALPGDKEPHPDWFIAEGDATSGTHALVGGYVNKINVAIATMANWVQIPLKGNYYMHFEHDDIFDANMNYDGGQVEYQAKGGEWTDASALFDAGKKYNGFIAGGWGNPLAGRRAFVYSTVNYTSTRINLATLGNRKVRFRFDALNDFIGTSTWYVDNVRIYACSSARTSSDLADPLQISPTPSAQP